MWVLRPWAPQLQEVDERGVTLQSSGFHLVRLPFKEEVRRPLVPWASRSVSAALLALVGNQPDTHKTEPATTDFIDGHPPTLCGDERQLLRLCDEAADVLKSERLTGGALTAFFCMTLAIAQRPTASPMALSPSASECLLALPFACWRLLVYLVSPSRLLLSLPVSACPPVRSEVSLLVSLSVPFCLPASPRVSSRLSVSACQSWRSSTSTCNSSPTPRGPAKWQQWRPLPSGWPSPQLRQTLSSRTQKDSKCSTSSSSNGPRGAAHGGPSIP